MGKFRIWIHSSIENLLIHIYAVNIPWTLRKGLFLGQVLETALLKAPLLYLRAGQLDKAVKRLAWRSNQTYWYSLYLALLFLNSVGYWF
jgi:hypothetical protein